MPKETVRGDGGYAVVVQWGKNVEAVQVGTTAEPLLQMPEDQPARYAIHLVNGWLRDAGMPEVDADKLLARPEVTGFTAGLFATITRRRDVNTLIENLKRARDGAFGRDE